MAFYIHCTVDCIPLCILSPSNKWRFSTVLPLMKKTKDKTYNLSTDASDVFHQILWNKNNIDIHGIFLISLRSAWYYGVQRQLYSAWRMKDLEPDFLVINQYIIYFHINLPTHLILIRNWIIKNNKYGDESLSNEWLMILVWQNKL